MFKKRRTRPIYSYDFSENKYAEIWRFDSQSAFFNMTYIGPNLYSYCCLTLIFLCVYTIEIYKVQKSLGFSTSFDIIFILVPYLNHIVSPALKTRAMGGGSECPHSPPFERTHLRGIRIAAERSSRLRGSDGESRPRPAVVRSARVASNRVARTPWSRYNNIYIYNAWY